MVLLQVVYSAVNQQALRNLLSEHLLRNLAKFGQTWHYQSRGIPQVLPLLPILYEVVYL